MKKIFFAFAMLVGSMVANAAEVKLAKTAFDVVEGGTVVIPIQLDLTAAEDGLYKTFQLDAVLSNTDFSMESLAMASERQTKADNQYDKVIAGKTIGIVGKLNAAVIQGTSGDFLYLTINAGSASAGDVCTITFSNAKGGNTAGVETAATIATTSITITVVDYVTIDENVDFTPFALSGKDVHLIRSFEANKFYTLCLPITANATKLKNAFGGTAPQLYQFSGVTCGLNGTGDAVASVSLNFTSKTLLTANTPYIIKPAVDVTDPVFSAVAMSVKDPVTSVTEDNETGAAINFVGTFKKVTVPAGALYLKSQDGKLYSSPGAVQMKGTRAYIDLADFETQGFPLTVKMCLDGIETGIEAIDSDLKAEGWFDLNGRKLAEKPATKGVYINNGKKVVVK